jgi:hypothetical protein
VDGRAHDFEVEFPMPPGWSGNLVISSAQYPIALEQMAVLRGGQVGVAASRAWSELNVASSTANRMTHTGAGWVPGDSTAALQVPVTSDVSGIVRVSMRLRVFKLLDAPLWIRIAKSYRNLLDAPGLADAESRTAMFKSAALADSTFNTLEWTQGGQFARGVR